MKASLSTVYHLVPSIIHRMTEDRLMIINVNDLDNKCYELDGISRLVFLKIDGRLTLEEIVTRVAQEKTLSEENKRRLTDDSLSFLSLLLEKNWVTV